jgi:hypothetical protein
MGNGRFWAACRRIDWRRHSRPFPPLVRVRFAHTPMVRDRFAEVKKIMETRFSS